MLRCSKLCLVVTVLVASCGPGAESTSSATTASPAATTTTSLPAPNPTSSTTTSTVPAIDEHGSEILVAGQDGIWLVDAGRTPARLLAHRAAYAVDDRRGGLLFQIDRGRRTHDGVWSTIVWRVPAGSASPQELLVPAPGSAHELRLHDAFEFDGHLNVLYTRSEGSGLPGAIDTLRRYDVEGRMVHELYSQSAWDTYFDGAAETEGTVLFTVHSMFGSEPVARSLDGEPVTIPALPETPAECFADADKQPEPWCPTYCVMSDEGTLLACASSPLNTWPAETRVTVTTTGGRELSTVTISADAERSTAALDLDNQTLVVNRTYHNGTHAEALIVDLDDPNLTPHPLPVAGQARLVRTPLDVGTPITLPAPHDHAPLTIAGWDGVSRWMDGEQTKLIDSTTTRVAFDVGGGTLVYQEKIWNFDRPQPILVARPGERAVDLVGTVGIRPMLWGVGEIQGSLQVIYERWPQPCGREAEAPCEGLMLALDLESGSERQLDASSYPGQGLGPAAIRNGTVLAYNSGAEIGDVGSFWLMDLDGNRLPNPVCIEAVDCTAPMNMLGALAPDATTIAFVADLMQRGDEAEYEPVARRFGVVDAISGEVLTAGTLPLDGRLVWLDHDGNQIVVSTELPGHRLILLVDQDGTTVELPLEGTATFGR